MSSTEPIRLDKLLVDRGLVASRPRAERMISEHGVLVAGSKVTKPGKKFPVDVAIELIEEDMPWVSRGALKLIAALDEWTDRREKIQGFFGPGVTCGITEVAEGQVEVELVSDGSDASGPGNDMDDMEVLPPLMPGLPPRYVKKGTA